LLPVVFANHCDDNFFFFLQPWYAYLDVQHDAYGNCEVVNFEVPMDFLAVGMAIVDSLTRLAGLVLVVVVISAGVAYIMSSGNPEKAAAARRRVWHGLIGLAIVFVAAGFVAFIGNRLNP
jgi:hypothetical protein